MKIDFLSLYIICEGLHWITWFTSRLLKQTFYTKFHIYFELFDILYAGDSEIVSETETFLNIFPTYCDLWKLEVCATKPKVMLLSQVKPNENFEFTLQVFKLIL